VIGRWREVPRVRALLWVAPCILAWSLIPRLALNPGNLDAFAFLFWSSGVSTACLLLCTRLTGHWRDLRAYSTTDIRRIAALAALGAFLYYALLYSAYAPCGGGPHCEQKAAIVVITQYTWPALTVLWSAVLLRETLTCRMLISLLLGIVAVAIGASGTGVDGEALGKLPFVILAAIVFGLYSTLLKRVAYEPYSSMAVGFAVATFLASLAAAQFTLPEALLPNRTAVLSVLVNGVFVNGLSYVCWYRALRSAPIGFVAPWVALTPLLAAVFANESVTFELHHWAGIGLVLLSALLATVVPRERVAELAPIVRTPRRFDLAEESR
jgi:drug/metabolite transporter (DMT)-like permease